MKIVFFEAEQWEENYLSEALKDHHELVFTSDKLDISNMDLIKDAAIISVFIRSKMDDEILSNAPELKLITTRSTGFEHIDLDLCNNLGITVTNVPAYGENTVAEHTFALILALSRNIHKAYLRTTKGDFQYTGLRGFDLSGKTIGVVGAGSIGLHVIRIAKGFGMNVLAYDVNVTDLLAEVLGFKYVDLDELLEQSDIISLHAPYNVKTHHLINKERLAKVKESALLINTARGGLIDTEALVFALNEGRLAGVGLDVLEGEDLITEERELLLESETDKLKSVVRGNLLLKRENVVITPHIAFNSQEALQKISDVTVCNIKKFNVGKEWNVVNHPIGQRKAA